VKDAKGALDSNRPHIRLRHTQGGHDKNNNEINCLEAACVSIGRGTTTWSP
jgi:hypothetical protein